MKILVADDDPVIRKLLYQVLSEDGHKVSLATNGAQVIEKVQKEDFELLLSDVHMPVMNGLETLRIMRSTFPQLPVVMMDSYPDQLVKQAENEGALICIHKPFDLKELREVIEKVKKLSCQESFSVP
jgi:two-component system response regulator (stage 0 sporulation protein F)